MRRRLTYSLLLLLLLLLVDTSKPLSHQEARHEVYMQHTVAELNNILAVNMIAVREGKDGGRREGDGRAL